MKHFLKGIIGISMLATISVSSYAEDGVVSFHGQDPSSNDLLNAFMGGGEKKPAKNMPEGLMPSGGSQSGGMKFRGISLKKNKPAPKPAPAPAQKQEMAQQFAANQAADACMAGAQSVAVNIRFKSNSSSIKGEDSQLLRKIAQAMNTDQLGNCYFVIEGHTDAVGEAYYNLWLSQKRAESVKRFLNEYDVSSSRMIVVGKGEDELLNYNNPNAAENRRVQFRVINSAK